MRLIVITAWYPSPDDPFEGTFVRDHVDAWKAHLPLLTSQPCDIGVLKLSPSRDLPNLLLRGRRLRRGEDTTGSAHLVFEQALRCTNRVCVGEESAEGRRIELGYRRLTEALGGEPDIVVSQTLSAAMWAVELRRRLHRAWPIVLFEHSGAMAMHLRSWCRRIRGRRALREADEIVIVADRQRVELSHLAPGRTSERIWNPVHPDFLTASVARPEESGRLRLVTVSRLAEVKGVDRLLRAVALLPAEGVGPLEIIGGGELEGDLRGLTRSLGIENRVVFAGACERQGIVNRLARGGIFLLTSRSDNCPVALLEAQCMGLPCVVTANGGNERVLLDGNGVSVSGEEPELPRAIAAAVLSVRDSLGGYRAEEIRSRAAAAFSPEVFARRSLEVFLRASERTRHMTAA